MSNQEERPAACVNKRRLLTASAIVVFILVLSMTFFWYGNTAYGLLMIGIPVVSLLISTFCYMATKNEEENPADPENLFAFDIETDDAPTRWNPFQDRPPSYRLTWRRSFMKRFKNRGSSMAAQPENAAVGSDAGGSASAQLPPDNDTPAADSSDSGSAVLIGRESAFLSSEDGLRDYSEDKEKEESGNVTAKSGAGRPADSGLRHPVTCQDSLPSYEEAIEIIRSREDLT